MTDFASLIAAVNESPECDTTRLVLADWLDEQESSSLTEWHWAHRDYIRLSCGHTPARVDRKTEQSWIKSNWRRFVPGLLATGFRENTHNPPKLNDINIIRLDADCTVRFDRGFVCMAWFNVYAIMFGVPPITEDAPTARFHIWDAIRPYDGDRVSVAEFAPRVVWQSIRGYTEIVTRGLQDLMIFAGPGSLARAGTELSEALRRYGESVNAKRVPVTM